MGPRRIEVDDASDPRLDDFRDLRAMTGRRVREGDLGHVVIEGTLALHRALQGPLQIRSVLVSPAKADRVLAMCESLPQAVDLLVSPRPLIEEVSGFDVHRGVLASAVRPEPTDPAELLARARRLVVLEALTDLENVGAAFRVAAALGFDAVLVDDACADPLYRRCVRVSLGWSTVIPFARLQPGEPLLDEARRAGFTTVALTPAEDSTPVDEAADTGLLAPPVALAVGAEGPGLTDEAISSASHRVRIPMQPGVDSLNAATALGVVCAFAAAADGWG